MNVLVIGLGLIGGSMALDIKSKNKNAVVFGMDENEIHLAQALEFKLIDTKATWNDIPKADLVIISVPVDATCLLLPKILELISDDTLVMDVGSTKFEICNSVAAHAKRGNYLATHPIAGTEFSGPSAAFSGMFIGKTNIICEWEKTAVEFQKQSQQLFDDLGMNIVFMDPKEHDQHIAYCSHLSHICSFMLGKTVIEKEKDVKGIFNLAGSGFASTVRLAKSSPAMWTPIFLQNKKNVIESLEEFILNLNHFKDALVAEDRDELFSQMKNVNRIKEILLGIEK